MKIISRIKLVILERILGTQITGGDPISNPPTFTTYYPSNPLSEEEWIRQVNFGRMYNKTSDKFFDRVDHSVNKQYI